MLPGIVLTWVFAAAPIALLLVTVTRGLKGVQAAALSLVLAAILSVTVGAGPVLLGVAVLKGLWLGVWIGAVVAPAMLLYGVVKASGLERIGQVLLASFPTRPGRLLAVAWILPSLIQAVAGFGTPLAIATPLMMALGWRLPQALVLPLIGYHWSVTFGSMGSSYFMASFTGQLGAAAQVEFATYTAAILGGEALLAGALILWLDGGLKQLRAGLPILLPTSLVMTASMIAVAITVPALASLAAAGGGLVTALAINRWLQRRNTPQMELVPVQGDAWATEPVPARREALMGVLPYVYLLAVAVAIYGVAPLRRLVAEYWVIAPNFPATSTSGGWSNPSVTDYTPFALLGHPGSFLLAATTLAATTYIVTGTLTRADIVEQLQIWRRSVPRSVAPIIALSVLATVMVDAGMISTVAAGLAQVTGPAYPLIAPWIGALGSFLTGSTTTSNALFSSLQIEAATVINAPPTLILAAQTVGGNIGNALSPIVILVGLASVHRPESSSEVLRVARLPVLSLLLLVSAVVMALSSWPWSGS